MEPVEPESPMESEEPVQPRMLHFKVPFCARLQWNEWAKKFFDPLPSKALVMVEQLNKSTAHVHMQGTSSKSDRQIKRLREDLTHEHSLFKEFKRQKDNPDYKDYGRKRCRLIQTVDKRRPANETGFQYMCKEFHPPLYVQGFTQEELKKLHEDSEIHVENKKMQVQDAIDKILSASPNYKAEFRRAASAEECKKFLNIIHYEVCETYRAVSQKLPKSRYFADDVINALYQRKDATKAWRVYLANKLARA